jgi:hypothetical protein
LSRYRRLCRLEKLESLAAAYEEDDFAHYNRCADHSRVFGMCDPEARIIFQ